MSKQSEGLQDVFEQGSRLDEALQNANVDPEIEKTEPAEDKIDHEPVETKTPDPEIEKAARNGWKPKDQWDGDPDDWVSARRFNERGEMMGRLREMQQAQSKFEERLANQRKFMELQNEQKIKDLEAQRQNAVELADVDKFNAVQKQIEDLREPGEADTNTGNADEQTTIDNFNTSNPWIFEQTPKAAYAKSMFNMYLSQGMNAANAIEKMQGDVNQHFPPTNSRRHDPATSENPSPSPRGQRKETSLQWNQLTRGELQMWNAFGKDAYKGDKKAFLQSVKDSRNET